MNTMYEMVDGRTLIIKEYTNPYDVDSLTSFSVVYLPSGKAMLEDITLGIVDAKSRLPGDGSMLVYNISDRRNFTNLGCSGAVQAIELAILGGIVSGLAESFINNLLDWCRKHFKQHEKNSIKEPVEEAMSMITSIFKPQGVLNLTELKLSGNEIKIIINDNIFKYYILKTLEPIISIKIRKIKL